MRSFFKKTLLVTVAILCTHLVKAQDTTRVDEPLEDYVITSKGDTLICRVGIPLFGKNNYQTADMGESKKIKPGEIKEYYIKRKNFLFRSVWIDGDRKPDFLPVLEKGKIWLYQRIIVRQNATTTTSWFVSKKTDTVYLLKENDIVATSRKERKNRFEEMLMDNKPVYDQFVAEKKFTYKKLQNIIHLYNTGEPFKK